MKWLNFEVKTFRSTEYLGSEPIERATWISLLAYCADHENGGIIEDCADWKCRRWQQLLGITKDEVDADCELWTWLDSGSLAVWGYPAQQELETRSKSIAGKLGGRGGLNRDQLAMLKEELTATQIALLTPSQINDLRHAANCKTKSKLANLIANLSAELQRKCKGKGNSKGNSNSNCNDNRRRETPAGKKSTAPDYPPASLPKISDYGDISAEPDPIVAAMAVTKATERRDWGYWVKVRHIALRSMSITEFESRFRDCVAKVYGESRAGELNNAAASLNVELRKAFNLGTEVGA